MNSRWDGPRQDKLSVFVRLNEGQNSWSSVKRGRGVEGDSTERQMAGFTAPDQKCAGCSDCIGKSLEGFKQEISIIWFILQGDYSGYWGKKGNEGSIVQQGDQGEVRGGDGIDLDEKSREGEKLLGSGHV